jgi:hypothetical protein
MPRRSFAAQCQWPNGYGSPWKPRSISCSGFISLIAPRLLEETGTVADEVIRINTEYRLRQQELKDA